MGKASIRLSLKTIAMLFPYGSMERIYLHGRWQLHRGRNPSMLFGNHQTANAAYVATKDMHEEYFDEVFRQHYSRQDFFWSTEMVLAVQNHVPVPHLPLIGAYRKPSSPAG